MKFKMLTASMLISALMVGNLSASAQKLAINFDRTSNTLAVQGEISDSKSAVTITVVKNQEGKLGEDYLPDFISIFDTDENGKINLSVKLPQNTASGKYFVYNDGLTGHDFNTFMLVNVSDQETQSVLAEINQALKEANESALIAILQDSVKAEKAGIDIEDEFIRKNLSYIGRQCYLIGQGEEYTADAFCTAFDKGTACAMMADQNTTVEEVMLRYAPYFGTTYEEYLNTETNEKQILDTLLKAADFSDGSLQEIYLEKLSTAKVRAAKTWSYLRDEILSIETKLGINTGTGSDYAKISPDNQYKVFTDMFAQKNNFTGYADMKKSFDSAVSKNSQIKATARPSGGGGGGTGGSGKSVIGVPTATPQPSATPTTETFSDIQGHWSADYVEKLAKLNAISGFEDHTFKPNQGVTRAEFVKMLTGLFGINDTGTVDFADVSQDDWFYASVKNAANAGIVQGNNGYFMPQSLITRQDAAVMLYRIGTFTVTLSDVSFSDEDQISDYAKEAVDVLAKTEIIVGDGGLFRPQEHITRGETATLLYKAYMEVHGK